MQLWQAGCGEAGDGVPSDPERPVPVQNRQVAHVRVHGQLHPQTQTPPGKVHDEQCPRKLYNLTGK